MAIGYKKSKGRIVLVCALALAVMIPTAGWLYGRISASEHEQAILNERNKLASLWEIKDKVDRRANSKNTTEKELIDRQLAVLSAIEQSIPGIVCWGDSITAGVGGGGNTYPAQLQQLLQSDLNTSFRRLYPAGFSTTKKFNLTIPVVNMGVAGESSLTVAGRNGAIPYVITEAFTIPEDTTTEVRIRFTSQGGEVVEPLIQGTKGLSKVMIGGVEGVLEIRQAYGGNSRYAYYFTRTEAGEAVTVAAGSPIETQAEQAYKDNLAVIQIGHNGGWTDANDLIAQIRAIIAAQNNPDRYIVLGLAFGDTAQLQQVNQALSAAFGDHFIDLWQYMRESGLSAAGIEATVEDTEALAQGLLPTSLTGGANNFNSIGYSLVAECIQRKMYELGYLDTVNEALSLTTAEE